MGTVTPIINTLIGFFLGLSSGAGVVISQYYGAGREDKVRQAVHTSLVLTLLMGAVFTAAGIAMTPLMLRLMKTPAEVAPEQTTYLTIYFAGVMGLLIWIGSKKVLRPGKLLPAYIILYFIGRLWVEALRSDHANTLFGLRINTVVSMVMVLVGLIWVFWGGAVRQNLSLASTAPAAVHRTRDPK